MEKTTVVLALDAKRQYTVEVPDVVAIDPAKIDKELAEQPEKYLHFARLAALFTSKRDRISEELKTCRAKCDVELRKGFAERNEKITEDKIKNLIESHQACVDMKSALLDAEEQCAVVSAIKEAFYHRKDMLVSLAANMRAELEGELFIKKRETK